MEKADYSRCTPTPVLVVGVGTVVIYVERPWVPLPAGFQ